MKLDGRLLRHSKGEPELLRLLDASKEFREIVVKVLTSELESAILKSEGEDLAGDMGRLAHLNGQRSALRSVLKLLSDPT